MVLVIWFNCCFCSFVRKTLGGSTKYNLSLNREQAARAMCTISLTCFLNSIELQYCFIVLSYFKLISSSRASLFCGVWNFTLTSITDVFLQLGSTSSLCWPHLPLSRANCSQTLTKIKRKWLKFMAISPTITDSKGIDQQINFIFFPHPCLLHITTVCI